MNVAAESRLRTLLRVGSVRYTAFYFAPFYAAIAATGHGSWGWFVGGLFLCTWVCLCIELLNRVKDEVEDRINNPERTALCDRVGYGDLNRIVLLLFFGLIPVGIGWLIIFGNWQEFFLQCVVIVVAWNYSAGVRFKAWRHAVLIVMGATFVLPFLVGWAMYAPLWHLPPPILLAPLFIASIAGMKDLTDVDGDRRRGYRGLLVDLAASPKGRGLLVLLLAPYLATGLLVLVGWAPDRFLWLLGLAPGSLAFARLIRRHEGPVEARAVREVMYSFWFVFLALVLLLMHPTVETGITVGFSTALWLWATRSAHWAKGLTAAQFRALATAWRRR